jgi:hypothetical protein
MSGMRDKHQAKKPTGSTTNASDAVNDTKLPPKPTTEQVVDHAGEESFPASDPVAVGTAVKKAEKETKPAKSEIQPPRRSPPDWLLHPPR